MMTKLDIFVQSSDWFLRNMNRFTSSLWRNTQDVSILEVLTLAFESGPTETPSSQKIPYVMSVPVLPRRRHLALL